LKRAYGTQVEGQARLGVNHVTKGDFVFLPLYYAAHVHAITQKNIKAGFAAAGLVPFDAERVLASLPQRTPTLPDLLPSPPSLASKTPYTAIELQRQAKVVKKRRVARPASSSSADSALDRLIKGTEMMAHDVAIVKAENAALRAELRAKRNGRRHDVRLLQMAAH